MSGRLYDTGGSLALSASAGSGKTHALTTRLAALLLEGAAPSEILSITFTRAAAGEIREKLFQRILMLEQGEPEEEAAFVEMLGRPAGRVRERAGRVKLELVRRFSLLHISTIHSFLLRVVRQFPLDTGVVELAVVDDQDRDGMVRRAIESFFDQASRDRSLRDQVLAFLSTYREQRVTVLGTVRELFVSLDRRRHLLDALGEFPGPEEARRRFRETDRALRSTGLRREVEKTAALIRRHQQRRGEHRNLQSLERALERFLRYGDAGALAASGPLSRYAAEGLISYLRRMRDEMPPGEGEAFASGFHRIWSVLREYLAAQMRWHLAVQLDIYARVRGELERHKRSQAVIDYADIELLARDLLRSKQGETVIRALESPLRHLLIDEFQDTSELQWETLRPLVRFLLAEGGTLFYVGDVKQSIYRWRGGQPWLFDQVRTDLGLEQGRLPYSYRHNAGVLDFVNRLFGWFAGRLEGGFRYLDQELPPGAGKDRGYVHVGRPVPADQVLGAVLESIRELETAGVGLGDMAVLCRTNQEVGRVEALFRAHRVPFSSAGRTRLKDDWCVGDLMGIMRFVLEPGERLHPWAVLRTPLFRAGYPLLEGLARRKALTLEGLRSEAPRLHRALLDMTGASRYASPSEFLRRLFTGLPVFESYPGKEDVLLALYEAAYRFENEREPATLRGFLRHLQEREDMLKTGAARGVSVQTIHSAKGLEFHTVIVPFLSAPFNGRLDGSSPLFCRQEGGPREGGGGVALALPAPRYRDFAVDPGIPLMVERFREESRVDEVNALYVALTRARENLVLLPAEMKRSNTVGDQVVEAMASCFGAGELPWTAGEPVASERGADVRRRAYLRVARPAAGDAEAGDTEAEPRAGTGERAAGEDMPGAGEPRSRGRLLAGLVVHRALEMLRVPPQGTPPEEAGLDALAGRALAREGAGFTSRERDGVRERAVSTLRSVMADRRIARFLGPESRAELGVASGEYPNLLGRIDRVLFGEVIEVLDFKTAAAGGEGGAGGPPGEYREQVHSYCALLQRIFPSREVHGYLYFTEAAYEHRLVRVR
ncbi:MAG: UvrD-helicase domain-containing protein [Spirochaetota bacterium]